MTAQEQKRFMDEWTKQKFLLRHYRKSRNAKYIAEWLLFSLWPGHTLTIYQRLTR